MGSMTFNHSSNGKKDKLIGEFKRGRINGMGTKSYKNGDVYVGPFKNDLQDGTGMLWVNKLQINKKGVWTKGSFIRWIGQNVSEGSEKPEIPENPSHLTDEQIEEIEAMQDRFVDKNAHHA